jgi:hypothetical protein
LSMFVVFFPSTYLLYTSIEEIYLSLPFSKWDFLIIFIGGVLLTYNYFFTKKQNQKTLV